MKKTIYVLLAMILTVSLVACTKSGDNTEVILSGIYIPKDSATAGFRLGDGSAVQYFSFSGDNVSTDIDDVSGTYIVKDGKMTFGKYSIDFHKYEKSIFLNGIEFVKGDKPSAETKSVSADVSEDASDASSNINNIVNLGYAANTSDYIYYSFGEPGLFRMRHDGSDKIKLCSDTALYLNISNGWVYYWKAGRDKGIYRIRTNGMERAVIKSGTFVNVIVYGDWIYYIDKQSSTGKNTLCRMKLDGSTNEQLRDDKLNNDYDFNVRAFVIAFDHIYCIAGDFKGSGNMWIYEMELNGDNGNALLHGDTYEYICATDNSDSPMAYVSVGHIFLKNTDGYYNLASNVYTAINYNGGYIYYVDTGKLSRIRLDKTDVKNILGSTDVLSLNIAGDKIFYFDTKRSPFYFSMNTDGTNITPLCDIPTGDSDFNYSSGISEEAVVPNTSSFAFPENVNSEYDIPFTLIGIDYHFVEWMMSEGYFDNDDTSRFRWVFYSNNSAVMAAVNNGELDIAFIPYEYFDSLPDKGNYRSAGSGGGGSSSSNTAGNSSSSAAHPSPVSGTTFEVVYALDSNVPPREEEVGATRSILEYRFEAQGFTVNNIQFNTDNRQFVVNFTQPSNYFNSENGISLFLELGSRANLTFRDQDGKVILEDTDILGATQGYSSDMGHFVQLELSADAQRKFADATARLIGQKISIYLDEVVLSAPIVNDKIVTSTVMITGNFTSEQATRLAALITPIVLPYALRVESLKEVAP